MDPSPSEAPWWKRLHATRNDDYQLVLRKGENLREIQRYEGTLMKLSIILVGTFTLLFLLTIVLLGFTPLQRLLPGYGEAVQREELNELEGLVGEMEQQLTAQSLYIDNLLRTVRGEATTEDDIEQVDELIDTLPATIIPASEDEIRLRREVDLERLNSPNRETLTAPPAPGSDRIALAQLYLVAPVNGEISAGFNPATAHRGVDILAPQNTPIKACRDGVVFLSEFTSANGNVIGLQHDNNLISFYKHNSQLLKEVGDRVRTGEAIAIIGNTGELTSGPHLHFELWHEGGAVDPVGVVRF